ncbi:MAG: CHASE2 domain-containing protein [Bdellovibrionota bacterium]
MPPPPWLTTGENYGFVNLFPERDNRLRRTRLIHGSTPSLSLRCYHRLIETPPKRDLAAPFWIDFRGPENSFPSYHAEAVIAGEVPADAFKNKVVLIGPTTGTVNRFETPFGSLSRLEIHANIMDTFLDHRELVHLPTWVTVTIGAAAVLASATIILSFPLSSAWICLLLLALFLLIVSLFLFAYFQGLDRCCEPFGVYLRHSPLNDGLQTGTLKRKSNSVSSRKPPISKRWISSKTTSFRSLAMT